jgi:uncharacterized protein YjlB
MSERDLSLDADGRFKDRIRTPVVAAHHLADDGSFPNNELLPLMVYGGALDLPEGDPAALIEIILRENGWGGSWRSTVFGYHHYHSTAHEMLGIYSGRARVLFGGDDGPIVEATPGDVIIIPAGVAHNNLGSTADFRCVGAYPRGQSPDMNYGQPGERPRVDQNIARVPLPLADPIYGSSGPLCQHWPVED